jgi:hypothetical protein
VCTNNVGRVVIHEKELGQLFHRLGSPLLILTTGKQNELESGTAAILKPHTPSTEMFGECQPVARLTRLRSAHPCMEIVIGIGQTDMRP